MELDFKEAGESAVYRANNSNLARCYLALEAKLAHVEQERDKVKGSYMRLLAAVNSGPSWSEALDRAEAAEQDRDRLAAEVELSKSEAAGLATWMWAHWYKAESPNWGLCDSVPGIISQIDNMVAGVRDKLAETASENERLVAEIKRLWARNDEKGADLLVFKDTLTAAQQFAQEQFKAGLERGYDLGFAASGEGWNGEYGCEMQEDDYYLQRKKADIAELSKEEGK